MAIGVDDLLEAAAIAAAQEFGKQIAKGLCDALFGHLAGKEDLEKAIREIEAFVTQKFDELNNNTLYSNVFTAIEQLNNFTKTGSKDVQFLHLANDHMTTARGWINIQRSSLGRDYLRLQYVPIVQYIVADIAIWSEFEFSVNHRSKPVLLDKISDHTALLAEAVGQIRSMETLGATPLNGQTVRNRGGRDPDGRLPDTHNGFAWFEVYKGPNFVRRFEKLVEDSDGEVAKKELLPEYNRAKAEIDANNNRREELIFKPAEKFRTSMENLRSRLHSLKSA